MYSAYYMNNVFPGVTSAGYAGMPFEYAYLRMHMKPTWVITTGSVTINTVYFELVAHAGNWRPYVSYKSVAFQYIRCRGAH